MNLEMLDGYFAALISSPDTVGPSRYFPHVLGEEHVFDTAEQATAIISLMMRHWNTIAFKLLETLEKDNVYLPVLLENEDGIAYGNDWAKGFMCAVQSGSSIWSDLIDDEERGGALVPIMMLAHEHDPDPKMRPDPIPPEKREKILQMMTAGLAEIYRYFEPCRRSIARPTSSERGKDPKNQRRI